MNFLLSYLFFTTRAQLLLIWPHDVAQLDSEKMAVRQFWRKIRRETRIDGHESHNAKN